MGCFFFFFFSPSLSVWDWGCAQHLSWDCSCTGVLSEMVKGFLEGFSPVRTAGFHGAGFGRCFFMDALLQGWDLSLSPSPPFFMSGVTKGVVVEIKTISMKTCSFQANIPGGFHGSTMVKRNNAAWHQALTKKKKKEGEKRKQKSLCQNKLQ